jgi:hypothetical protein
MAKRLEEGDEERVRYLETLKTVPDSEATLALTGKGPKNQSLSIWVWIRMGSST